MIVSPTQKRTGCAGLETGLKLQSVSLPLESERV